VSCMEDVYVVDYLRTPFSKSKPTEPEKDVYNSLRMDQALAQLINAVITRTRIDPADIGDVITGCSLQVDENWLYGGRHPVLLAGLPVSVPGLAMDRACASSLEAVATGSFEIMTGHSEVVLAGGMEHMTHVPMSNNPHMAVNSRLILRPEYLKYQMNVGYVMGLTAEKLADESGIKRGEMDAFAVESHKKASRSVEDGWLREELLPIRVEVGGKEVTVEVDQSIRKDTGLEQLARLPSVFKEGGAITAGNSSPLNAGASLVALMSATKAKELGVPPIAKVVSFGWAGVDPSLMGKGPVPASLKALAKAGLRADDIDLWEINEAFAVVVLYAMRELGIDPKKVNIHGGAIAIGHPLGASGARLVGTLARELRDTGKRYGMATLCVGGGQGFSAVLERV
jgi:acetyl-CoA acetyltransferase family protein